MRCLLCLVHSHHGSGDLVVTTLWPCVWRRSIGAPCVLSFFLSLVCGLLSPVWRMNIDVICLYMVLSLFSVLLAAVVSRVCYTRSAELGVSAATAAVLGGLYTPMSWSDL